ncbi:Aconitate hydratase 2 [Symbiodinium microadriaticum]|uniref:Aconitate hydratase 2 n=1 Tax=Symbiodinium microadriaticum TaxID=2951 RepID=A0A1Q9F589_SYMMI|nr:Aconitate hydratase 2 [Symbiodinium microadriaticum]
MLEDIVTAPIFLKKMENMNRVLLEQDEWHYISMDATLKLCMKLMGQASYRSPKSNESADQVVDALAQNFSADQLRAVVHVGTDQPSEKLFNQLKAVCPSMRSLVLDPIHLAIVYEYGFWSKHSPGSKQLRRILKKCISIDADFGQDQWGTFYGGTNARPLTEDEMKYREMISDSYMDLTECNSVLDGLDTNVPFTDRLEFIQCFAALCRRYPAEVEMLGWMQGGYNVAPLVEALDLDQELAAGAVSGLNRMILMFDAYHDVEDKMKKGNPFAKQVIESWANADWFTSRPTVPEKVTLCVFKVTGETNTDDLSPAPDAWSRPVKLSAVSQDIPCAPNKRTGGFVIGGVIDSGALPLEMDVKDMNMGDLIDLCVYVPWAAFGKLKRVVIAWILAPTLTPMGGWRWRQIAVHPMEQVIKKHGTDEVLTKFDLKHGLMLDQVQAGGRIPLIIGRGLTNKARESLNLGMSTTFKQLGQMAQPDVNVKGFTLAQKMVGKACGVDGVVPGAYCEPRMGTVGSQDTTGPMTRDELKDLACLGFQADLVMQSFCHTAAYPKPVDAAASELRVITHRTLPKFIADRGGVALRPGDGIIHSWLNRMLLPDEVGTGFPLGISFPAGSGLVAFGAATGVMPLNMPESVLVRFSGKMQPGVTLRDLVHAIPYYAIKQAFELSDASAERSAAGCTIKLNGLLTVEKKGKLLKWMISEGYSDPRTLARRVSKMEKWLESPTLMEADKEAEYAARALARLATAVIDINLDELKEPVLCCPNDPDDAKTLTEIGTAGIDEVFIGTLVAASGFFEMRFRDWRGHYRAAGKMLSQFDGQLSTRLWIAPPTKMDEEQLTKEGYYSVYGKVGARTEMPGCSLCMGNQEYLKYHAELAKSSDTIYQYLNFDQVEDYVAKAGKVQMSESTPTVHHAEIDVSSLLGDFRIR